MRLVLFAFVSLGLSSPLLAECPDYFDAVAHGEAIPPERFRNGLRTKSLVQQLAAAKVLNQNTQIVAFESRYAEAESVAGVISKVLFLGLPSESLKMFRMLLAADLREAEIHVISSGEYADVYERISDLFGEYFFNLLIRAPQEQRVALHNALRIEHSLEAQAWAAEVLASIFKATISSDSGYRRFVEETYKVLNPSDLWEDLSAEGQLDVPAMQVAVSLNLREFLPQLSLLSYEAEDIAEIVFAVVQRTENDRVGLGLYLAPVISPEALAGANSLHHHGLPSLKGEGLVGRWDEVVYYGNVYVNADGELVALSLDGQSMQKRRENWLQTLRTYHEERLYPDGMLVEAIAQLDELRLAAMFSDDFEWNLGNPIAGRHFFSRREEFAAALAAQGYDIETLRAVVQELP